MNSLDLTPFPELDQVLRPLSYREWHPPLLVTEPEDILCSAINMDDLDALLVQLPEGERWTSRDRLETALGAALRRAGVKAGAPVLTLEAMKMNTVVSAPTDGTVSVVHVNPGDVVEEGQPLLTIK